MRLAQLELRLGEKMSFFSKIFGKNKEKTKDVQGITEDVLQGIIDRAGFDLDFSVSVDKSEGKIQQINVNFTGADQKLLTDREGSLLDAFQLFIKRAVQHHFPEESPIVQFDADGYREEANRSLIELVEKLRDRALDQGKSVYLRQLAPKDRKVVHQFLAEDGRVKSRSIGDGLYKKIKIYPVRRGDSRPEESSN